MARIVLIHWKPAEAERCIAALGGSVDVLSPRGEAGLKPLAANPPDAVVIDLDRIPSQGCAVGMALRRRKGTREIPLVFAGGLPEKVARTRALLPDAQFTSWDQVRETLRCAKTPAKPAVPDAMAGYSGRPLVMKLGIRAGTMVALCGAPKGFEQQLEGLPADVSIRRDLRVKAHLVMLFVESADALEKHWARASATVQAGGSIWVAWPKGRKGFGELAVRAFGLASGFVDYKICAIDAVWSGLRFARRSAGGSASA